MKLCETCGRKPTKSATAAECWACYARRRRTDPVIAEQSRAISRAWKDGHREANRARDRQFKLDTRPPCPTCGTPMAHHSAGCDGCRLATADVRRTLAEGMWADGWPLKDMAAVLGVKIGYFGVRRARDGWDMPHRYKVRARG